MERYTIEYVTMNEKEKDAFNFTKRTLENLCEGITNQIGFSTLSDLYMDTKHLIEEMNNFEIKYYNRV